jgi:FixJ family two-component response regulator
MNVANSSSPEAPLIHIVEDDESSGAATARVLRAAGLSVQLYRSAPQFLANLPAGHGCIVLDLSLPGPNGLELQERLAGTDDALPVVFLTGHGDVPKTA